MPEAMLVKPDQDFIRQVKNAGGDTLKSCYQCATCSVVCNLSSLNLPFPRKQMILAQWGLKDRLLGDPSIWLCHQCNDCTVKCPRQAKPGDVFAALRSMSFLHYSFPSFMGKALASPKALPILFLIPFVILLLILIKSSSGDFSYLFELQGEVDLAKPFPHGILEMLFIGGNVLIFAFAAAGLLRFWKSLKNSTPGATTTGFVSALIATGLEITFHRKFTRCDANKARHWGHLLLFYGTVGSAATAALALLFTVILNVIESPINFPHPIKLLGILSGIAMLVGGWILITRRISSKDEVGVNRYQDWLFLIAIFGVGLTGMLAYLLRIAQTPLFAYLDYYIHLILVFFLLWYAPYSKFAHMFYRTLALVYAKSVGCDQPRSVGE
ncbi:MAG: quinone-interacting membrane-bound oxidoreductase complex subunit QmoC [bacterium]